MRATKSSQTERLGVALAMKLFEQLGFAFREQRERDFGIDAHAELIDNEKPTGRLLAAQLKSGPSYFTEETENGFVHRVDPDHVDYWLNHSLPVLVCLCDIDQDTIYWTHIRPESAISTGKGYKVEVPKENKLVAEVTGDLRDILTPIVPIQRYTLMRAGDQSHGTAKRYEFKAILNGTLSKAEIAYVVRRLTDEGAKRRYYRNHLVEGRWGDSDAHVVWTFVYPTFEDHERNNFICRSIWINDDLPHQDRPYPIKGENIGNGIILDWNSDYEKQAEFWKSLEVTKEEYLNKAIHLTEELIRLSEQVISKLTEVSDGETAETAFLVTEKPQLERIREIYGETGRLPLAPVECGEVHQKLLEIASYADNIALLYSDTGLEKWDKGSRIYLSMDNAKHMRKAIEGFKYELEKVR